MSIVSLRVNGATHEVDVEPATPLLYVLRNDLGLHGPRFGCGLAPVRRLHGHHRRRRDALVHHADLRARAARSRRSKASRKTASCIRSSKRGSTSRSPQCGYCQNGQIMTAKALLDQNPHPTDAEIRDGMEGIAVSLHDVLPDSGRDQTRRARRDDGDARGGSVANERPRSSSRKRSRTRCAEQIRRCRAAVSSRRRARWS